ALTGVSGSFLALGGREPASLWAAGSAGALLRFESGAWARASETVVTDIFFYGAYMTGPADGWAVGTKGTLLRWNGTGWAIAAAGTTSDLLAIHGSGPSDVWIGGYNRNLLHATGGSFQQSASLLAFGSSNSYS